MSFRHPASFFLPLTRALLPGVMLALATCLPGAAQTAPADTLAPTLEISYGAGPLQLTGGTADGKVRWTAPAGWGKDKDSLLVYLPGAKRGQLFVRPTSLQRVKDTKEPLLVSLPERQQVEVQGGKGALSVSRLQGRLRAETESGPITVEHLQGSLYASTREGNVTVRASKAVGHVSTGKGDVLIENTEGEVAGFSRQGKVTTRFTRAYLSGRTTPFEAYVPETHLEVETLPQGGFLQVRKGSVLVQEAPRGVQAWMGEGDITLEQAAGTVKASIHQGNISAALLAGTMDAELFTDGGNVTVTLPASFSGTLYLDQRQDDARKGTYQLKSDFDLGSPKAEPLKGPQGQTLAFITQLEKSIGTGKAVIRIRAVNGNITILKK